MPKFQYNDHEAVLQKLSRDKNLTHRFKADNAYLKKAFKKIQRLWMKNLAKIRKVKYILIAEAPLWGKEKKYIYNPKASNTQFFHLNDLAEITNKEILDKKSFLKILNELGIIVVDIAPFALNEKITAINYRKLSKSEYTHLLESSFATYFETKLDMISKKKAKNVCVFYRYERVKKRFGRLIGDIFLKRKWVKDLSQIQVIMQKGGGINRMKLLQVITKRNGS